MDLNGNSLVAPGGLDGVAKGLVFALRAIGQDFDTYRPKLSRDHISKL
jgi:hypothetical protein